jgi:hypothetical protein
VAYVPDWERLAGALRRVIEAAGCDEKNAKHDICHAIADSKIRFRVTIAKNDSYYESGNVFSSGRAIAPPHLEPEDFNWGESQPLKSWPIAPGSAERPLPRERWPKSELALIELWTADVSKVLCGDADKRTTPADQPETKALAALSARLQVDRHLSKDAALKFLKESDCPVTVRGFQARVWPQARELAGLPTKASPGRKKKSTAVN